MKQFHLIGAKDDSSCGAIGIEHAVCETEDELYPKLFDFYDRDMESVVILGEEFTVDQSRLDALIAQEKAARRLRGKESQEAWERREYARLKAKFGAGAE